MSLKEEQEPRELKFETVSIKVEPPDSKYMKEEAVLDLFSNSDIKIQIESLNDQTGTKTEQKDENSAFIPPENVNPVYSCLENRNTPQIECPTGEPVISEICERGSETSQNSNHSTVPPEYVDRMCRICKKLFDDAEGLMEHDTNRIKDPKHACCDCGKRFRDNTQLNVHARKHTGEKPYHCDLCSKSFSIKGNLIKHMLVHTGERRFECEVCEKRFSQYAHLEDHVKIHSDEKPFKCEECSNTFRTKARMKKHALIHDETRKMTKRSIQCPVCLKILKGTIQMTNHMSKHTGEKNDATFTCEVCGKTFHDLVCLQGHQKTHAGIRPFKCSLCDKTFVTPHHLRRHMNTHTGYKPFTCEVCMKSFPSLQNMKRHMLCHTGEKNHVCTLCGKDFRIPENLQRHMRIHTGEKPFPCDICGRFFAHSTSAKEHRRIHTGDRPFGCGICDRRFKLNKDLYKHIRRMHPQDFQEFKETGGKFPLKSQIKLEVTDYNKGRERRTEDEDSDPYDSENMESDGLPPISHVKVESVVPLIKTEKIEDGAS